MPFDKILSHSQFYLSFHKLWDFKRNEYIKIHNGWYKIHDAQKEKQNYNLFKNSGIYEKINYHECRDWLFSFGRTFTPHSIVLLCISKHLIPL